MQWDVHAYLSVRLMSLCCPPYRETHVFEMLTLTDQLVCKADTRPELLTHLIHILKVLWLLLLTYQMTQYPSDLSEIVSKIHCIVLV